MATSPVFPCILCLSTRFCVGFPTLCQGLQNLFICIHVFVHKKEVLVTWFLAISEPRRLDFN